MSPIPVVVALAVALAVLVLLLNRRDLRRRQALSRLLDAADALEARLRAARTALGPAGAGDRDPVQDAMREMLRQRLWLQQHGASASLRQLDAVSDSIDAARRSIERQLQRVEHARASGT